MTVTERIDWPGLVKHVAVTDGRVVMLVDPDLEKDAVAGGLLRPWRLISSRPAGPGTGRGARGTVRLGNGVTYLVKHCLRGGLLATWNRDRYFMLGRFARELHASRVAVESGAPVAPTVAVVLRTRRPGHEAWAVSRFAAGYSDLARLFVSGGGAALSARALFEAALVAIHEMHEAGVHHRDMNLGNLVARQDERGRWQVLVVDLDRARHCGGPVSARLRSRTLARLERSWVKVLGADGVLSRDERISIESKLTL